MKVEKTEFRLNTDGWKFKANFGARRMKLYIKLTKPETERWQMIKSAVMGDDGKSVMSDDAFAKVLFFRGINGFMEDVNKAVDEMDDAEKERMLEEAEKSVTGENIMELSQIPTPKASDENTADADV
jgi:hypothetical protein